MLGTPTPGRKRQEDQAGVQGYPRPYSEWEASLGIVCVCMIHVSTCVRIGNTDWITEHLYTLASSLVKQRK